LLLPRTNGGYTLEKGGDTNMADVIIATREDIKCRNVYANLVVFPQRLAM